MYGVDYSEPQYEKFSKRKEKIKGKKVTFNSKKSYFE